MTIWEAFKAGFGFLSIIPVGITMEGIDALMKRLYMYPVVGFCLGILIGIITFIAEIVLPSPLTIIAVMAAVYGIIWFNHLDGVADMGDGMTAHGSLEKKRKALKDMALGIGGVAFTVLLMLFFYSSLTALENAAAELVDIQMIPFAGLFTVIGSALADAASSSTNIWNIPITAVHTLLVTASFEGVAAPEIIPASSSSLKIKLPTPSHMAYWPFRKGSRMVVK